jgi:hypothetical protein
MNFFTPKLMKIRWSFLSFGSFARHFQIKLNTHGSNINSIFVIMSELEFFLLMRVLTQNFNTCGPCKISWKKSNTSNLDYSGHIEGDMMQNHEQEKKKWKKRKKTKILWTKQTSFLAPCPSALAVWAAWLHVGATQKI